MGLRIQGFRGLRVRLRARCSTCRSPPPGVLQFRFQGRDWYRGLGFRTDSFVQMVEILGSIVLWCGVWGLGSRVQGKGFRVQGFRGVRG